MTTDAAAQGRANLAVWEASKPVNFFTADANLQSVLRRILGGRGLCANRSQPDTLRRAGRHRAGSMGA
ncbi:MAG: hypothetical protein HND48_01690 [Chloroflexi bacterium]|nr:hypothetical protein [Chloroflexota bacterium]